MASSQPPSKPIVLIVEDEAILRFSAIDIFEGAGFEVLEAWDADSAIDILSARLDIGLVFTDVEILGPMDGLRLAA
ncbi:response regulator, partial [Acidisoma silvae]